MRALWQDIRYAVRVLWKKPDFTAVAVVALALGVGANTAIFSVVNGVLLKPLPYERPERLVSVWGDDKLKGVDRSSTSFPNFKDWREANHVFEQIAAYSGAGMVLKGESGEPEQLEGVATTGNLFELLGVKPVVGRGFTPEEEQPEAPPVALISYGLWKSRFGSDPHIAGRQAILDNTPVTIVGVLPDGFRFLPADGKQDVWMPVSAGGELNEQRGTGYLKVVARLKDGVSMAQAQAEMEAITRSLEEKYPEENEGRGVRLVALHEDLVGDVKPALLVLLGAVGFVLLIACANIANLLLARASVRSKEIAIRAALGASRWRIVRQLLTESLMLSLMGGGAGLLLALWGVDLLLAWIPTGLPRVEEVGVDSRVLLFTLGLSGLTGLLFGLAPAWQATRLELTEALKEGGRSSTEGTRRNRVRSLLVVSEVALSFVLLVCAGLLIRSFWQLRHVEPGFDAVHTLTATVSLPGGKYEDEAEQTDFFKRTLERTRALPGVEAAGAIFPLPLSGNRLNGSFQVENRPTSNGPEKPSADIFITTNDYFRAMGVPLIAGRAFNDHDTEDAPKVVVINETLVRRHFPEEDPLGKRLKVGLMDGEETLEIVGVVGDVKHKGLDAPTLPQYYISHQQFPMSEMTLIVRTATDDPASFAPTLRAAVHQVDADQPVYEIRPMSQLLANSVERQRFSMLLLAVFAGVALALSAVGIFSVISFSVAQRTHEIGIRIALGAQTRDILRLIVGQGMWLTGIGVFVGLVAAFALTRVMSSLLYGVSTTDPLVFFAIPVLLGAVALAANYFPARRATKVDPMEALRHE